MQSTGRVCVSLLAHILLQVVMRDCQRVHGYAPIYFIVFNDLGKFVFLNLYLATIIDKLSGAVRKTPMLMEAHYNRFERV